MMRLCPGLVLLLVDLTERAGIMRKYLLQNILSWIRWDAPAAPGTHGWYGRSLEVEG